ncbi:MAG: hypothetical protein ACFFDB_20110 [Promethearchaeota archaeon]
MSQSRDLLNKITDEEKIEILRKNWMSHDARAQMAIVREFGWQKGNKLNKSIIHEMGKVMMHRFMNAVSIESVSNIEELYGVCAAAMELYYPPPYSYYKFQKISDNELMGIVEKCPIIDNVKKLGVSDLYECGCFALRSGWYKALRVPIEESALSCIKKGDENCQILLKVDTWDT